MFSFILAHGISNELPKSIKTIVNWDFHKCQNQEEKARSTFGLTADFVAVFNGTEQYQKI